MDEESSDPIAHIEQDAFSHHPSNPFDLAADGASSDPILLTPSKRKSKRETPRVQEIKEEQVAMRAQARPGPESDAKVTLQTVPRREGQEVNADFDETQDIEQVMEDEIMEDETMEDYDEPIEDNELSEGDFKERTSDENFTFQLKSPEEQAEIEEEIEDLLHKVPQLADDYEVMDRLGTGGVDHFCATLPPCSNNLPLQGLSLLYTKPLTSTTTRNGITRSGVTTTLRIHLRGTNHVHVSLESLFLLPLSVSLSLPLRDE